MENATITNPLESLIQKQVQVFTADGRIFSGVLKGLDQALNTILVNCEQRIYSATSPVQVIFLGLYFLRGDSIVMIGEIDTEAESTVKWESVQAEPLKAINMQ